MKFDGAQHFDVRVWHKSNALVRQWSASQVFAQSLPTRTRAPGESATYEVHWTPSAAGEYHAMACLPSSTHAAETVATVSAA